MSEFQPTVSIIIPTYNSNGTLRLTLQTILWQDFRDFEVLVVGDACTDNSEAVVASFNDARLQWMNRSSNSGKPSLPRNDAIARARGRFIAYQGHDDLWFPGHISELVRCIEETGSDLVYSLGAFIGPHGVLSTVGLPANPWAWKKMITPGNWLHRKDMTEKIGNWPTRTMAGHDRDFIRRVYKAGLKIGSLRELTLLKFPAPNWQMYSLTEDNLPQTKYVERITLDPEALLHELLLEITELSSKQDMFLNPPGNFITRFFNRLPDFLMELYGLDRWPVTKILHRRWRQLVGLK